MKDRYEYEIKLNKGLLLFKSILCIAPFLRPEKLHFQHIKSQRIDNVATL